MRIVRAAGGSGDQGGVDGPVL